MKVGLFFGSFNPIHMGHLIIANYMAEFTDLQKIWLVVSPQNPLKNKKTLLNERQRFNIVEMAIGDYDKMQACDIEFSLTKPSYTINTLIHLKEKYPKYEFSLIMGSDNLQTFNKWKNFDMILKNYLIYVYPRIGYSAENFIQEPNVVLTDAPFVDISSTMIRDAIKKQKDVRFFVPEKAWKFINEMNFYKK